MPMQSMVLQSIRWIVYTTVPAKGNIDISHTKTLAEQFFNGQLSLHVAYADYHVNIIWFNCFRPVLTCFFYICFHFSSLPMLLLWITFTMLISRSMFLFRCFFCQRWSCSFCSCSLQLKMLLFDHYFCGWSFMLMTIFRMVYFDDGLVNFW